MYMLFAGEGFYPAAHNDFIGTFSDLELALERGQHDIEENWADWYTVYDARRGVLVARKGVWYGCDDYKEVDDEIQANTGGK